MKYIIKRILNTILSFFIIITITFFLIKLIPGNPIAKMAEKAPEQVKQRMYEQYGLNEPIPVQFKLFLNQLIKDRNLGSSIKYPGRNVNETIYKYAPISAKIGFLGLLIGLSSGIFLGLISGLNKNTYADFFVMLIAIIGVSIPTFSIASVLQYVFAIKLQLLPITGWEGFRYSILPSVALSFGSTAKYARYMRASCLDTLNQDYILTAKSKGASNKRIVIKHVLKNSLMPIITLLGPQIATIFTGSFIVERIFSIPGIGSYFVQSVQDRDYTMIMGQTIFFSILYMFSLLLVDIMYMLIDPRIKLTGDK